MPPSADKWIKGNEKAWDHVTPIHQGYRKDEAGFFREGGSMLDSIRESAPGINGKGCTHWVQLRPG